MFASKQRLAEAVFQLTQLNTERGLGDLQVLSCSRETAFVGDGAEVAQVVIVQERHDLTFTIVNDLCKNIYWKER
jgi:hypothetical protein